MMRKIGNDGKDGVVWKGGVAVNGGGWWFGWWWPPLGRPVALTKGPPLNLPLGRGRGMARGRGDGCCGRGCFGDGGVVVSQRAFCERIRALVDV